MEAKIGTLENNPLKEALASTILGRPDFVDQIRETYLGGRKRDRDIPAIAALTKIALENIVEGVESEFHDKPDYIKKAVIYLSHRFNGLFLKEIGKKFGIMESAVSQASRRFEATLSKNAWLKKKIVKVRQALNL